MSSANHPIDDKGCDSAAGSASGKSSATVGEAGRATHISGHTDGVLMTEEMIRVGAEAIRLYLMLDIDAAAGARGAAMLAFAAMRRLEPKGSQ